MSIAEKLITESVSAIIATTKKKYFIAYFLIGLLILNTYWFIAIFLFAKSFYKENPLWITIVFSFGLSFVWMTLHAILEYTIYGNEKIFTGSKQLEIEVIDVDKEMNEIFFGSTISANLLLCAFITIYFLLFRWTVIKAPFHLFVLIIFMSVIVNIIGHIIRRIIFIKKQKKNNKTIVA